MYTLLAVCLLIFGIALIVSAFVGIWEAHDEDD